MEESVGNTATVLSNDLLRVIFRIRFRYFLAVKVTLNKTKLEPKSVYLSGYNEIFIHDTPNYFDRNRIYGGLGYMINKNIKIEMGFMNQIFNGGSRDQFNVFGIVNF